MSITKLEEMFVKIWAEENGWLDEKYHEVEIEKAKEIARTLISLGDSVEKVAKATKLPLETIRNLA